jgi:hypothetical protein
MDGHDDENLDSGAGRKRGGAPAPVRAAQALFLLMAAVWFVFGVWTLVRGGGVTMAWILSVLMFGNAAALLGVGWGLGKQQRRFFYLGLALLAVNIVLTVTDEFGPLDLATLLIDVALLCLLIATRARYPSGR